MKRIDPELSPAYRKDELEENFLANLNEHLFPFEMEQYEDLECLYPSIHVIGAPRSGTTLLTQLIATHINVSYINNLVAAFWQAPVCGIRLSKKLLPGRCSSSLTSDFGRTKGISEPHEFGYFWARHLQMRDLCEPSPDHQLKIDWQQFSKVLNNMTAAAQKPILFKSLILGWFIEPMLRLDHQAFFLRIRRNPIDNAESILKARKKMLGSTEQWISLKPKQYETLKQKSIYDQVIGQVLELERAHTQAMRNSPPERCLDLSYEELCNDPTQVLERVCQLLNRQGQNLKILDKIDPLTPSRSRYFDQQTREQLEDSLSRYRSAEEQEKSLIHQ